MKIVLGSASSDKANILTRVLSKEIKDLKIYQVDVDSQVPEQPLTEENTVKGAVNRAKNALIKSDIANLGIGMEGGISILENNYYLVCVCAIVDKTGRVFIGIGSKLQLPKKVGQKIKSGAEFGKEIRAYSEMYGGDPNFSRVSEELISRNKSFSEAIRNAYITYLGGSHL